MLGVSGLIGSSSGDGATSAAAAHEGGGGGGGGGAGEVGGGESNSGLFGDEDKGRIEEGDRNSAGNRWPRQETMALLKIRSDMDGAFRDSSLKGPLWEEVSRKLAELGYHRSAKKCKEKFENVYKYHKRTKEGRATKSDGKTYRFFDQLQALEHQPSLPILPPPRPQTSASATAAMPAGNNPPTVSVTVPSTINPTTSTISLNILTPPSTNPTIPSPPPTNNPAINPQHSTRNPTNNPTQGTISSSLPNAPANLRSYSTSSSSSTSSDEDFGGRRKRKRKWKDFFERLMKEVIERQEELQKKFLDAIEKRERDRMVREEAWKMQEMARLNREHDILVQERSMAAAKDAAVIAFLQKISDQQNPVLQMQVHENSLVPHPQPQPLPQSQPLQPQPQPPPPAARLPPIKAVDIPKLDNGENSLPTSSSRWPKAEVQALIQLRTSLDVKYQDSGPKGPLWEEISAGMGKLGYNRNAKRCKEKWENINKYFKKVKESNKQRPEDSKTCPYFHLLDALYKEKNKSDGSFNPSYGLKPENAMIPLMVQPEQQWPLQQDQHRPENSAMEDIESENMDQNHEEEEDGDDEEEDEGGGYEIVSNKPSSMGTVE